MIVEDWLCRGKAKKRLSASNPINNHSELYQLEEEGCGKDTCKKCTVSEKLLVNTATKNRVAELCHRVHRVLTCDVYKTIED